MHLKIPPLILAGVLAAVMWVLSWLFPQFVLAFAAKNMLAAFLVLAGLLICGLGLLSFYRAMTTVNPRNPNAATSLVSKGIYRFSRNPMYLGFVLILVGWGVYLAHILALLLVPAVYVVYMNRFQIAPEEQALHRVFGDEFVLYKSRVRKWL